MSATGKLIQSLKAENYIDAKKHFTELVADKMRNVLAREYRDVSQTFVKEDVTQVGPDPATNTTNESESTSNNSGPRSLSVIAADIRKNWPNVNYAAKPYLNAMSQLDNANDMYGHDSAKSVILYFLNNATSWRGPEAKRIKDELKGLIKNIREELMGEQDNPAPMTGASGTKSPEELIRMIKAGDTVTISFPKRPGDKVPQTGRGKAVMPSKHGGWVLNMGGAYGKPGIADEDNIVSFRRSGGKPVVARRG